MGIGNGASLGWNLAPFLRLGIRPTSAILILVYIGFFIYDICFFVPGPAAMYCLRINIRAAAKSV